MLAPGEKVNILLVDDQPARLLTYEAILGRARAEPRACHSGEEALAKLLEKEFAVDPARCQHAGDGRLRDGRVIQGHPRSRTDADHLRHRRARDRARPAARLPDRRRRLRLRPGRAGDPPQQGPGARRSLPAAARAERLNERMAAQRTSSSRRAPALKTEKTRELHQLNRTLERANDQLLRRQSRSASVRETLAEGRSSARTTSLRCSRTSFATRSPPIHNARAVDASATCRPIALVVVAGSAGSADDASDETHRRLARRSQDHARHIQLKREPLDSRP